LRSAVVVQGADGGVAFDGDADRAIFVSGSGKLVDGDAVLLVRADEAHADWPRRRRAGELVTPAVPAPTSFR
jgi:phosphoglucosamine mutase